MDADRVVNKKCYATLHFGMTAALVYLGNYLNPSVK